LPCASAHRAQYTTSIDTGGCGCSIRHGLRENDRHGRPLDLSGWTLAEARGISMNGTTIIGTGTNPDGFKEG
jgi:hypothetical protein